MKMAELHQILVDNGLDPYEGISRDEVIQLQRDNVLSVIDANLVLLSCPEWQILKEDAHELCSTEED